jgi:hypothetical protein
MRRHFARRLTGEDEVGSRKHSAQIGERRFHFGGDLAGSHIDGCYAAGDFDGMARATTGKKSVHEPVVCRTWQSV